MSVLKGGAPSVLARSQADKYLNLLQDGMTKQAALREGQVADAKAALTTIGDSANADVNLRLAQAKTSGDVGDVLGDLGMFANRGAAAKAATARNLGLLQEESTKISNLTKDLKNRNVLETWENNQIFKKDRAELGQFTPGTQEYINKATEIQQRHRAAGLPEDPTITGFIGDEFNAANYELQDSTIQAAIGAGNSLKDPANFTAYAQDSAVKTISDKLEAQWPGIRDKAIFDQKAKDIISKSKYGQNFSRTTKFEADRTTQDDVLLRMSGNIAKAIRTRNPQAVDDELNIVLDYLQTNNITGPKAEVFNKNIELALDRSNVDPVAIFESAEYGNADYATTKKITPTEASLLTADIKEAYRAKYPNLPDRLLDPQVAKVIAANQQLGFAISEGKKDAAYQANLDADFREEGRKYKGQQHKALFAMGEKGTKTYIADRLIDKLSKLKFNKGEFTNEDATEVKNETSQVIERLRGFFTDDRGRFLAGASKQTLAAFRLAASKAIIGNAGIDEDSLPGDGNDLVFATINRYRQMSDTSDYELLKLFVEALPDSQRSIEWDRDKEVNVKKGINRFTEFARGRMQDAHVIGLRPTTEGWANIKTVANNTLGSNFDRLPPIESGKYDALMAPVNQKDVVIADAKKALTP